MKTSKGEKELNQPKKALITDSSLLLEFVKWALSMPAGAFRQWVLSGVNEGASKEKEELLEKMITCYLAQQVETQVQAAYLEVRQLIAQDQGKG